jgi:hypothetical protein
VTEPEILQALEAQQLIQQRNPPRSERWQEASDNIRHLAKMLQDLKPEMESDYCALCRRSVDHESEDLVYQDGLILHRACAAEVEEGKE